MGTHLKFLFPRPAQEHFYGNGRVGASANNQAKSFTKGAVGLSSIQIWGQKVDFYEGIVNHAMPSEKSEEGRLAIDRLLIEQGMVSGLEPIDPMMDPATLATIKDMERLQA